MLPPYRPRTNIARSFVHVHYAPLLEQCRGGEVRKSALISISLQVFQADRGGRLPLRLTSGTRSGPVLADHASEAQSVQAQYPAVLFVLEHAMAILDTSECGGMRKKYNAHTFVPARDRPRLAGIRSRTDPSRAH